jgi:hypothetical protein
MHSHVGAAEGCDLCASVAATNASGGEPNQCAPLLEQMKAGKAGKAPVTVKPTNKGQEQKIAAFGSSYMGMQPIVPTLCVGVPLRTLRVRH